jgi:hypothetical protein
MVEEEDFIPEKSAAQRGGTEAFKLPGSPQMHGANTIQISPKAKAGLSLGF